MASLIYRDFVSCKFSAFVYSSPFPRDIPCFVEEQYFFIGTSVSYLHPAIRTIVRRDTRAHSSTVKNKVYEETVWNDHAGSDNDQLQSR